MWFSCTYIETEKKCQLLYDIEVLEYKNYCESIIKSYFHETCVRVAKINK